MSLWRDYLAFDKRQRNGVFILFSFVMVVFLVRVFLPMFYPNDVTVSVDQEKLIQTQKLQVQSKDSNIPQKRARVELFNFDPNNLSTEKWKLLGLKDWQIKIIHNYEAKGGRFRLPQDLKEIYGIHGEQYLKMEPYIQIDTTNENSSSLQSSVVQLFQFNPNNLSEAKWKMLGLKDWQIKIIHNYESKGGSFQEKDDLKDIYGINENQFNRLKPYIVIPGSQATIKVQITSSAKWIDPSSDNFKGLQNVSYYKEHGFYKYTIGTVNSKEEAKEYMDVAKKAGFDAAFLVAFSEGQKIPISAVLNKKKTTKESTKRALIELNIADSTALLSVNGVGPTYAQRIIKYRIRLGGFLRLEQLKEVYGITEDNFPKIAEQLPLDSVIINKININQCEWVTLVKHPYIDKNCANALINYRRNHGHFERVENVKDSDLVNDNLYRKIAPYIKTE